MKKYSKKSSIAITVILLSLMMLHYSGTPAIATPKPEIKIVNAQTGISNIWLGSDTEPMPPGGYPFTVNVVLEGLTESLFTYQITVKFDNTKIRCTDAWIPADDPNFVFFGKKIVKGNPDIQRANLDSYVCMGAALLNVKEPVDVSEGIFCKITFTAIKTGFSTLEIIPTAGLVLPTEKSGYIDDSFLWDNNMRNIPFTSQDFSINVSASPSPPSAAFTITPTNPTFNQKTTFDASASFDPDGCIVGYVWDFGDGTTESTSVAVATHVFAENGVYTVKLTLYDDDGLSGSVAYDVLVGQLPFVIVEC